MVRIVEPELEYRNTYHGGRKSSSLASAYYKTVFMRDVCEGVLPAEPVRSVASRKVEHHDSESTEPERKPLERLCADHDV